MNILFCPSVKFKNLTCYAGWDMPVGVQRIETFFKPSRQPIRPMCFWTWLDRFFKH